MPRAFRVHRPAAEASKKTSQLGLAVLLLMSIAGCVQTPKEEAPITDASAMYFNTAIFVDNATRLEAQTGTGKSGRKIVENVRIGKDFVRIEDARGHYFRKRDVDAVFSEEGFREFATGVTGKPVTDIRPLSDNPRLLDEFEGFRARSGECNLFIAGERKKNPKKWSGYDLSDKILFRVTFGHLCGDMELDVENFLIFGGAIASQTRGHIAFIIGQMSEPIREGPVSGFWYVGNGATSGGSDSLSGMADSEAKRITFEHWFHRTCTLIWQDDPALNHADGTWEMLCTKGMSASGTFTRRDGGLFDATGKTDSGDYTRISLRRS